MTSGPIFRCDASGWSPLSLENLDAETRRKVLNRKSAVSEYFHRVPLRKIEKNHHICPSEVLRLARRCMASDDLGKPFEWRGVLIHEVLRPYRRRKPIHEGHAQRGRGLSCAFGDLLSRKPEIAAGLRKELNRSGSRTDVREFKYSLKILFRRFRTLCREAGVRMDEYPFITKLQGYRSLGEFARREIRMNFDRAVKVRYGDVAASHMRVGTGHASRRTTDRPLDSLQLDGFDLPMIGCIEVETSKGKREVPVNRLWLCPIVDVNSTAILGYSASPRGELTEDDILDAFVHMMTPWRPRNVSASGLTYPELAGFPSGLSPIFAQCGCSNLYIDNAEIHLSEATQGRIARRFGCSINLGPVRRWDRRALVERIGGMLMREGFVRVPSSMGTGPKDPHRKDPVGTACRKHIHIEYLFDLIDVEIATLNGLQTESLFNISPLQYMNQFVNDPEVVWPVLPPLPEEIPDLDTNVELLPVAGSISEGRRAHITVDRVAYTNDIIAANPDLIGKHVWTHICRRDLRTIKVFSEEGLPLGTARALRRWSETPHSRQTRKLINSLKDQRLLALTADQDPVVQLVSHLSEQVRHEARKANPKISSAASTLVQVMRESGLPVGLPAVQPTYRPLTLREEIARKRGNRHDAKDT